DDLWHDNELNRRRPSADPNVNEMAVDQSELVDAFEKIALLPAKPTDQEIARPLSHALGVLEKRVSRHTHRPLADVDLIVCGAFLLGRGHGLAADGVVRVLRWFDEGI